MLKKQCEVILRYEVVNYLRTVNLIVILLDFIICQSNNLKCQLFINSIYLFKYLIILFTDQLLVVDIHIKYLNFKYNFFLSKKILLIFSYKIITE